MTDLYLLFAIGRSAPSIDRPALSMDPLLVQPSTDRVAPSVDKFGAGRTYWHGSCCVLLQWSVCSGGRVNVSCMRSCGKGKSRSVLLDTVCFRIFYFQLEEQRCRPKIVGLFELGWSAGAYGQLKER